VLAPTAGDGALSASVWARSVVLEGLADGAEVGRGVVVGCGGFGGVWMGFGRMSVLKSWGCWAGWMRTFACVLGSLFARRRPESCGQPRPGSDSRSCVNDREHDPSHDVAQQL
jgi:hypothetical protein